MKLKIKIILVLILLLNVMPLSALQPEKNYSGLTFTLSAGPSFINGFYDKYITNGYTVAFNTYYNFPLFSCNTYFKGGFSGFSYDLESDSDSRFRQLDILGGAGFFSSALPFVDLLAGVDIHGTCSNMKTVNTGRDEKTYKPSVSFNIGAMTYLGKGVGLFVISDYRLMKLSGKNFYAAELSAGLTYNYNSYKNEVEYSSRAEKKLEKFNQGLSEFKKKNFNEAKTLLTELYGIDKNYPGLDYYIKRIEEIESNKSAADAFIKQQNYLKAIPHLEGCSAYMKDCELNLLTHRKNLRVNIPKWEADGIKRYDEKDYKGCIEIMERILLVDPENKNAAIYLPRAIKRQKAIESM